MNGASPMLDDLWDELKRGRVYECSLRDAKWQLDGFQSGENIYIDPRPAILETLVHELLHRRKPTWGERRVDREAKRILCKMTEQDLALWWRRYQRFKRKSRPVVIDE